jgi:hypothetical protein
MSVRLFHRGGRLVMRSRRASQQLSTWRALHLRPVAWEEVFRPALALLGFTVEAKDGVLRFGETGSVRWTRGAFWTTIRLQLPTCSPKKGDLLAAALLKAARYRSAATDVQPVRARSA